jgi:hypothetical protein
MTGVNRIKIIIDGICHNCSLIAPVKEYSINGQFSFDLKTSHVESSKSNKAKQKSVLSLMTYCLQSAGNVANLYPATLIFKFYKAVPLGMWPVCVTEI